MELVIVKHQEICICRRAGHFKHWTWHYWLKSNLHIGWRWGLHLKKALCEIAGGALGDQSPWQSWKTREGMRTHTDEDQVSFWSLSVQYVMCRYQHWITPVARPYLMLCHRGFLCMFNFHFFQVTSDRITTFRNSHKKSVPRCFHLAGLGLFS